MFLRFLLSILVLTHALEAHADDVEDRARAHFQAGQGLTDQSAYADAYVEFAAGYSLSRRPLFLFNMAECSFHLGRTDEARSEYQRYLEADPDGRMAPLALARLRRLGSSEETETAAQDETTQAPPEHDAHADRPSAQTHDVVEPSRVAEAALEREAREAPRPPIRRRWQFWTGIGVTVAALATAVALGFALGGSNACGSNCASADFR